MNINKILYSIFFSFYLISGCSTSNGNRQLTGPNDGIDVKGASNVRHIVSSRDLEISALNEFKKIKEKARKEEKLAEEGSLTLKNLKKILFRLKPFANMWNSESKQWDWEVILIKDKQLNAFCFPGGKIAFFSGIIKELKLSNDEIAMIMGHEMAHAIREHARTRIAKAQLTDLGAEILSATFGLGKSEQRLLGFGSQLINLKFSRSDESDADLVGLDIAARGGYNPNSAITLWLKMQKANKNSAPEWLSTHPSGKNRINEIKSNLKKVVPLYKNAIK